MNLFVIIFIYYFLINLAGFFAMAIDKWNAIRNAGRITEKTLFWIALLGGALGSSISMNLFSHKTRHWYFKVGFYGLTVIQSVIFLKLLQVQGPF